MPICWRTTLCFSIKTSASSETAASTAPDKAPFSHRITPVMHLPVLSILRLNTPKPNPNVILCAHRVFSPHPLMSAWSGQVRVDIQLISWNAFCYSQLRRLTGSNLLTFFLTYLVTFFLFYLLTYLLAFFLTYLLTFFLTYLLQFFLTYVLTFFLAYLLTFFLTYLLTCFLTYLLTFFLTYPRQNIASTASHTSHSINSIFTSHHAANVISMTTLCLSNGNSTVAFDCIRPPRQKAVKSKDAKSLCMHIYMTCIRQPRQPKAVESQDAMQVSTQPQLHLMACVNHEARRLPLWFFHLVCVGGSAWHIICLPLVHSNLPKRGRSAKDCSTLLQLVLALRIWNSPPFIRHILLVSLHNFFQDKHTIPSMCSARRLHAHVHALRTNKSQLVAPHMTNSFGKPIGSPYEDCLRTCHHNLRHGCQTKLTCLHKKKLSQRYLLQCATSNEKLNAIHKMPLVHTWILVIQIYVCIYTCYISVFLATNCLSKTKPTIHNLTKKPVCKLSIFSFFLKFFLISSDIPFDILSDISSDLSSGILSDISFDIISDISSDILSDIFSDILSDISFDILSDKSSAITFDILSDISSDILSDISSDLSSGSLSDISFDILSDISSDILSDIFSDILSDISFDILSDKSSAITFDILSDISFDILSDISSDILSDISFDILSDKSSAITFDILSDLSFDILSGVSFDNLPDISFDIRSDILFDISFWHSFWHIFWHSFWHIFWHSFWHIFFLTGSRSRSGTQHWSHRIAVEVRHATLISQDSGWGPTRNTDLTESRWRSGTQHWPHRIAVEVRHATLISWDRGWGPARNTDLTGSRLRSGTQHWSHRIAVEVRHKEDAEEDAEDAEEEEAEEEEEDKCWHKI